MEYLNSVRDCFSYRAVIWTIRGERSYPIVAILLGPRWDVKLEGIGRVAKVRQLKCLLPVNYTADFAATMILRDQCKCRYSPTMKCEFLREPKHVKLTQNY